MSESYGSVPRELRQQGLRERFRAEMQEDMAIEVCELGKRGECMPWKNVGGEKTVAKRPSGDGTERLRAKGVHLGKDLSELLGDVIEFSWSHGVDNLVQRDARALFHADIPNTAGASFFTTYTCGSSTEWGVMEDSRDGKREAPPSVEHRTNLLRVVALELDQHIRG